MSFFKSLKGKLRNDESNNQGSPEIDYDSNTTKREKHRLFGLSSSSQNNAYDAPSTYNAPDYPPPKQSHPEPEPQALTKRTDTNPPPYQDWLSVPDNSQLPPPPALNEEVSPTNNASGDAAERGRAWCAANSVYCPVVPSQSVLESITLHGNVILQAPSGRHGVKVQRLPPQPEYGITARFGVTSPRGCDDVVLLSSLPLYFAAASNPLLHEQNQNQNQNQDQKQTLENDFGSSGNKSSSNAAGGDEVTISYSVQITSLSGRDSIIAVGFAGKPYPPFRQPGWHRSSFAVHSDDGHRYIQNPWGGIPFIRPLAQGDLVTLSITFRAEWSPAQRSPTSKHRNIDNPDIVPVSGLPKCRSRVDVYVNGNREGGWDMHEEKDSKITDRGSIEGLQGEGDLYAAVGVFGKVACEVKFGPGRVPNF